MPVGVESTLGQAGIPACSKSEPLTHHMCQSCLYSTQLIAQYRPGMNTVILFEPVSAKLTSGYGPDCLSYKRWEGLTREHWDGKFQEALERQERAANEQQS